MWKRQECDMGPRHRYSVGFIIHSVCGLCLTDPVVMLQQPGRFLQLELLAFSSLRFLPVFSYFSWHRCSMSYLWNLHSGPLVPVSWRPGSAWVPSHGNLHGKESAADATRRVRSVRLMCNWPGVIYIFCDDKEFCLVVRIKLQPVSCSGVHLAHGGIGWDWLEYIGILRFLVLF